MTDLAFDPLCAAVCEALGPVATSASLVGLSALEKMLAIVRSGYIERGAIYGHTAEGLAQWLRELGDGRALELLALQEEGTDDSA